MLALPRIKLQTHFRACRLARRSRRPPTSRLFDVAVAPKRYFVLCQQGDLSLRKLLANPNVFESHHGTLIMKKGVLYNVNPGRRRRLRFVVPSAFRRKILESFHESAEAPAFGGKENGCEGIREVLVAGSDGNDPRSVRSCAHCQLHEVHPGPARGLFHPVPPPRLPFDRVGIDHIGPFQTTKRGYRHLVVAVDYFHKVD